MKEDLSESNKKFVFKRPQPLSVDQYVEGILNGNRTILSKAITLVESSREDHHELAQQIIEKCIPHSGNSIRIGITGVPGVGKSTFIEAFGYHLIEEGHNVCVLAIDPSSQRSKGSILGDKTRMEKLSTQKNAFIRPSPSAGALGGVANATRESILLCEAAGFDTIIVETVGVGQSEITVHGMVDFFLLLMLAGAGDELQGIKRGIMEMADAIAINKADGDNLSASKLARREYLNALHLFPPTKTGWTPRVETCSAIQAEGIQKIWELIQEHKRLLSGKGFFEQNRKEQAKSWMHENIAELLKADFFHNAKVSSKLPSVEKRVLNGEMNAYLAAKELLDIYKSKH
tara:strand:- start:4297 stop:5331 length:1035 start_codon:yes stop_codon:yes gene_type:complete